MRAIKFRAWHKVKKEMVYLREIDATCAEGAHIMFGCEEYGHQFYNELDMNQWELMQFTGLIDKKGKEVFEGDILKKLYDASQPFIKVAWHTKRAMFIGNDGYNEPLYQTPSNFIEIIGNIYENPELIQK